MNTPDYKDTGKENYKQVDKSLRGFDNDPYLGRQLVFNTKKRPLNKKTRKSKRKAAKASRKRNRK